MSSDQFHDFSDQFSISVQFLICSWISWFSKGSHGFFSRHFGDCWFLQGFCDSMLLYPRLSWLFNGPCFGSVICSTMFVVRQRISWFSVIVPLILALPRLPRSDFDIRGARVDQQISSVDHIRSNRSQALIYNISPSYMHVQTWTSAWNIHAKRTEHTHKKHNRRDIQRNYNM